MKPRLLDLFCGAGGAAMGYHRAGFLVVGVDIKPQPHYPFEFHQADALTYPLNGFDAIHASPPCQAYSITKHAHHREHPDLVPETIDRLDASGLPYVIENVVGAPLPDAVTLCGSMFDLTAWDHYIAQRVQLKRHRLFQGSSLARGMRIRSGHNPEDWIDCPPANPGSMPIRGSLVQGAPGPVAQRRLTRNQTRKDERAAQEQAS